MPATIPENPLGKSKSYIDSNTVYNPGLLYRIARSEKRQELSKDLTFVGEDIWNVYELSWLNPKGLPQVALAEIRVSADSPYIVESKSLKLYLNSLNQKRFVDTAELINTIQIDLSQLLESQIRISLQSLTNKLKDLKFSHFKGELIDESDIEITEYRYNPSLLEGAINTSAEVPPVNETLLSHLLRSNCLITNQPDWGSLQIKYQGNKIDRNKLLAYLISFRSHNEFHEQCVERIFNDLKRYCKPEKLTVYARYTRRGGIDINPWRSDFEADIENLRQIRQ